MGLIQLLDLKFRYTGVTGPDKWGTLSPSYSMCFNGKRQSPIEIVKKNTVFDQNLGPLIVGYNDASATLINNGFNVELRYENDVGDAIIAGKNYTLKQMHWHSPSEHTIDGVRYAAELHLVHQSVDGNIAVVAILYKYGAPDPLLSQIVDKFDQLTNEGAHIPIKRVGTKAILQSNKKYFRYEGSLTTPPCSEIVIWNILEEVREISKEQVAALKTPLDESCKNNSRPTQPLNGRPVEVSAAS
ncbi:hypothetical protein AQUCO_00400159v1 [Aquilegia coerulea]|uniref:Carbonic anhydrase n=1 Tax=Aquilegia coerulea TaxID=218851 RepID=A0A2G5ETP4_AQUCA|nr:hypothetical protein AQUCO_00400159v1 [Aquilegia coerulea]